MLKVALVFNDKQLMKDNIFTTSSIGIQNLRSFFLYLKKIAQKKDILFHTLDMYNDYDEPDFVIFFDYPQYFFNRELFFRYASIRKLEYHLKLKKNYKKNILYIWESPLYCPYNWNLDNHKKFSKILTYSILEDAGKYKSMFYSIPSCNIPKGEFKPLSYKEFKCRKLSCMVSGNKGTWKKPSGYKLRYQVIDYFENKIGFDLFGVDWDKKLSILDFIRLIKYPKRYLFNQPINYQGQIPDKSLLSNYKFVFSFENYRNFPGYVTEKILDTFISNTVPIYNGENIIDNIIPKNTYIDINSFSNMDSLYNKISNFTLREYNEILSNIHAFLRSDKFLCFTHEYNAQKIIKMLEDK